MNLSSLSSLVCCLKLSAFFPDFYHTFVTLWMASISVGVGASQRKRLSVLARNPHQGFVRKISNETGSGRGKEGPKEQSVEGSSRDPSTEQISQEMRVGQRGDQPTEVRKAAARNC